MNDDNVQKLFTRATMSADELGAAMRALHILMLSRAYAPVVLESLASAIRECDTDAALMTICERASELK